MAKEKSESKPYIGTLLLIISFAVATVSAGYIGYWLGTQEQSSKISTPAWRTYVDQTLNFSFLYPANWSGEIAKEGYLILKGPTDDKGHIPNIIVQAMLPASKGGNYTSYEDAALDTLNQLKGYENYSLVSYTQTTVSNEPAREIVCSYSYGGIALKQNQVLFQDSNTSYIYMICYTATEESYPEYVGVYEKVKGTFILPR
jgi:hypothetical protein